MKQIWVVVANSSVSKIYKANDVHTLTEINSLIHPQSHLKDQDLISDREGVKTQHNSSTPQSMESKNPKHVKEATTFAKQIAAHLEKASHNGGLDKIYLIAPPSFLGILRPYLGSWSSKIIVQEIGKDLSNLNTKQLREYLPPVL